MNLVKFVRICLDHRFLLKKKTLYFTQHIFIINKNIFSKNFSSYEIGLHFSVIYLIKKKKKNK